MPQALRGTKQLKFSCKVPLNEKNLRAGDKPSFSKGDLSMNVRFHLKILCQILVVFMLIQPTVFAADVDEIRQLIEERYVDNVDDSVLQKEEIDEIIAELDPYSAYFTGEEYNQFMDSIELNYTGIGIVVEQVDEGIFVLGIFERSPANEAGIEVGDVLIEADGTSLGGKSLEESTSYVRGEEGTSVDLKVLRPSTGKTFEVEVERAKIAMPTVESAKLAGNIGYIHLYSFNNQSVTRMKEAMKELGDVNGWIIDVQDNSGGYLHTAQQIAGFFPKVKTAVIIEENQLETPYPAVRQSKQFEEDVYLLINQSSASASEILAGALKDSNSATLYGQTTFGKGLVQNMFQLSDGSVLKLTVARFYTPSGDVIQEVGIAPNVKTEEGQALAVSHRDMLTKLYDLQLDEIEKPLPTKPVLTISTEESASAESIKKTLALYHLGGNELDVSVYAQSLTEFQIVPNEMLEDQQSYVLAVDGNERNKGFEFTVSGEVENAKLNKARFVDVKDDQYFTESISALVGERIIQGVGDNKFLPFDNLTRKDAAVLFSRALNLDEAAAADPEFDDVESGTYFFEAIAAVKEAGIMNGRSATTFDPDEILTREEMAALISRAFQLKTSSEESPFEDVAASSFKKDIIKVYESGITKGYTETSFAPKRAVTRADFATFLYRALIHQAGGEFELASLEGIKNGGDDK
jgi:carboxyl-terminal processing protease